MGKFKEFLQKKDLSSIFIVASFICAVTTLIVYVNTGIDQFTTKLSAKVIVLLIICAVLGVALSVFEIKTGKYIVYLLGLWAWLSYIITQVNYIANLIADIDGNSVSLAFISTVLCGALTWVFSLVSVILQKKDGDILPCTCKNLHKEEANG